ncbi:ergosterol biosynthetic protein 28 homolog isoform X1 [Trichechus manatus latirostris]|uniref:Ergosterol biosynthetic protein 28 homolog isoform X1 n=2 Tax=Trichechus manatus latirostris TaxID=127582 RepID=A0A2Y9G261_TRIMA|nr:ergosterol biosynthetic protein 28 homolog isoform X1 [Trichechus manatus latirostris]
METTQSGSQAEGGGEDKWLSWTPGWSCPGGSSLLLLLLLLLSWESGRQKALSELRRVMSRFLNVLRSWLVMVAIIAMGNTLQSFRDHTFLYEKLYTGKPDLVNGLQARTFGIWTLLSSVIRCLCAIDIHNKTLYHITLWTFLLALGHFLSELFVYGTAAPTVGVLAPLMVASFSVLGMLVGLQYLEAEPVSRQKKRN